MSRIHELTGLRGNLPIGVMAALGLLRVCQRVEPLRGARLSWRASGASYSPVLHLREAVSERELIVALAGDVAGVENRRELTWAPAIKSAGPRQYREELEGASPEMERWLVAFGNELATDKVGKLRQTPFDMSVARQQFLADAVKLGQSLGAPAKRKGPGSEDAYREALFGPWRYQDDQHSLGWDPSTLKLGAFTGKAPTAMPNTGVRAAVWLALESLPLFPCSFDRRLRTRGFVYRKKEVEFRWPVWREPLCLVEVETLLSWKGLVEEAPDPEESGARGIAAVYGSTKFKPNQYMVSFRAARLVAAGGAGV